MLISFPKIFTVGTTYITDLFKEPVEVTEKVDGSQFSFGKVDGQVYARSKGAALVLEAPQEMFKLAVERVLNMNLPEGLVFYCEYLRKERHNILTYSRVPKNNLTLFGVMEAKTQKFLEGSIEHYAEVLDIDPVPVLHRGMVENVDQLKEIMDRESYLGGPKIEGVVVKNYSRPFLLGGQPIPLMSGKLVREDFKEVLKSTWAKENTSQGNWEEYCKAFRTEARWQKSLQHLGEAGKLTNTLKDIGPCIKEIRNDIEAEEKENIKEKLWSLFGQDLLRKSTAGFPEWFKERLANEALGSAS